MKRRALRARGGAATWALVHAETTIWRRSADGWLATALAAAVAALSCAWLGKLPGDLARLYPYALAGAGALAAIVATIRTLRREGALVTLWLAAPLFGRELARAKVLAAALRAAPVVAAAYAASLFELRPNPAEALALLFIGLASMAICTPLTLAWDLRMRAELSPLLAIPCALVALLIGTTATLPAPYAVPATLTLTAILLYFSLRRLGEHLAAFECYGSNRR
ncbi:hypothetical protein EPN42_00285 [bacterium]|nr:MAG: hypothetical protein EPN42_00285 [bacterium]